MARLTRRGPAKVVLSSDDEAETPQDFDDELPVIKSTKKRSAPSSRSSKSRGASDGEGSDEELPVAKRKTMTNRASGRMFMVSVEGLTIYPHADQSLTNITSVPTPGSSFSKTPLLKATKQLSMDNFFSSPGSGSKKTSPLVIVPAKSKRKAPAKPVATRTFVVRVPEKRPIAKATGKASKSKKIIEEDPETEIEKDDESDFSPEKMSSGEDAAETEVELIATEDEESDLVPEPSPAAAKKSSKGKGKVKVEELVEGTSGPVPRHHSQSVPCGLDIKPREGDLPPISDLQQMFDDIISRAPEVTSLFGATGSRKLRVATMCSGTESPLLALGLMGRSLQAQKLGKLELDHIFSCEIEPYKQA